VQTFTCNICDARTEAAALEPGRESMPCARCASTVRMRSAMLGLSTGLFGTMMAIADFPRRPKRRGVGLSDWDGYARRLRRAFDYRNTFVHRSPKLDITAVPVRERARYDFVIAIDVFEHVPPPVRLAFEGAAALLKPGGVFVFSVPYTLCPTTVEHFADLARYEVVTLLGHRCLVYETTSGELRVRTDLVFHGGEGSTLEMRLFSRDDVVAHLRAAGFTGIREIGDAPEWGVVYDNPCSQTIVSVKSATT
jgi:SAM-dependent methyltransferase